MELQIPLCLRRNMAQTVLRRENRKEIGGILGQLSEWKGVKIVEAEVCPDHIHMLVEIPPVWRDT